METKTFEIGELVRCVGYIKTDWWHGIIGTVLEHDEYEIVWISPLPANRNKENEMRPEWCRTGRLGIHEGYLHKERALSEEFSIDDLQLMHRILLHCTTTPSLVNILAAADDLGHTVELQHTLKKLASKYIEYQPVGEVQWRGARSCPERGSEHD